MHITDIGDDDRQCWLQHPHPVRLVIQFIPRKGPFPPHYVLLIYPGRNNAPFNSTRFPSREALLAKLGAVLPGLEEKLNAGQGDIARVVFAQSLQLSEEQVATLGFA
jgi:hypothetical protein